MSPKSLDGPIRIAQLSGDAARLSEQLGSSMIEKRSTMLAKNSTNLGQMGVQN